MRRTCHVVTSGMSSGIQEPNWETMRTGVNSMFRFAVLNIANADAFSRGLQGLDSTEIKSEACTCLFWQVIIALM